MVSNLIELANLNSGSSSLDGLCKVANWLSDWMDLPADHQRIVLPPRQFITDEGELTSVETGPLLRWDYRPKAARRVLLAIHYDTVFDVDHPFQHCQRLSDSRLQGPGTADAKGGIVVLHYALRALLESGCDELGWTILLNPDEELGSPCSKETFRQAANEFDFGLLFEPALPSGALVSHRKGSGAFTLVMHGKSAHAGRDFQLGRNAVAALCRLVERIDQLNGQRAETTINVGRFVGGGPVNVVPQLAIAKINTRVPDSAAATWFETTLQSLVEQANQEDGLRCDLHGSFSSPAKMLNPAQLALMNCIEKCSERLGHKIQWQYSGGVCDGNKLAAAGLPNIDTLGPIGDGLHSHHEWVDLTSLVPKAQLIVEILTRFSQGEFPELARTVPRS